MIFFFFWLHSVVTVSKSLQVIQFHLFYSWEIFPSIYIPHFSVDGHLGCFQVLAIVNSVAMDIEVHVSFWIMVSSGYMPVCVHWVAQSCLTLCYLMDYSPPGSSVRGIFQARILEWVAISYSRGFSWPREQTHISCISCVDRQILCHWTTWEAK